LSEGICGDDPSVIFDAALQRPILDGGRDPEDSSEKLWTARRSQSTWRSLEEGNRIRRVEGHQRFRKRRRLVKRKEYFEEPVDLSISAEQAEWESVEKGSKLWEERRALYWKLEAQRMEHHSSWDEVGDLEDEKEDQEREWTLRHLEIHFIRLPHGEDGRTNMWKLPDNQEPIREMVEKNPLFKEGRYREMWLDHQDPSRVQKRIDQQLRDHKAVVDRMERWQIVAQQEQEAERRKRSGGLFLQGNQTVNGEGYVLGAMDVRPVDEGY
jgi:hypothetical protein